jgi:hypothetical protein
MYHHGSLCLAWAPLPSGEEQRSSQEETLPARPDADAAEVRHDLIARVRKEIAAGTYDTEEKWEVALDRLCRRLERF